jgi:hypothetical protein
MRARPGGGGPGDAEILTRGSRNYRASAAASGNTLHGANPASKLVGNIEHAGTLLTCGDDLLLDCSANRRTAKALTFGAYTGEPRMYTLHDYGMLEFGKNTGHLQERAPCGGGSIDLLLMQINADMLLA